MIKKAVLPVAGLGTRMLPASKAIPKEMLTILDKPAIQYIVEEAQSSGIEDFIFVISRGKEAILDHFDLSPELEMELENRGKKALLEEIKKVSGLVRNLSAVRQKKALGLGHAILVAAPLVGKEPFAVLLGDDIVDSEKPCLKQLIEVAERIKAPVIAVERVPKELVSLYGIISGEKVEDGLWRMTGVLEKPRPEEAPSDLAIIGRYIFFPEIFEYLEKTPPGSGGEIQLTDAISNMIADGHEIYAFEFEGTRYDAGNKLGLVKATLNFALKHPQIGPHLREYIKSLL